MKRCASRWFAPLSVVLLVALTALWISQLGSTWLTRLEHWNRVVDSASHYLLLWRLLLYGVIAWLWYRLDQTQLSLRARAQWRRLGVISTVLIIAIEISRAHLR